MTTFPAPKGAISRPWDYAAWAFVIVASLTAILMPLLGLPAQTIALLLTVPFAFIHGIRRYGLKDFLIFFVVTVVISNVYENLSILVGFPFGNYYYTGGPQLFFVPVYIGPIYFGLGYMSWLVASALFDKADEHLNLREKVGKINLVALPALAGAVMTMFDVSTDSIASTVGHNWIWEDGGGLFGVPYTNYLGWWLVTYTFFQIFAVVLARRQSGDTPTNPRPANFLQPMVIYLSLALSTIAGFIRTGSDTSTVVDAVGVSWQVASINESMMIIAIFSMLPIAFIALVKTLRGDSK